MILINQLSGILLKILNERSHVDFPTERRHGSLKGQSRCSCVSTTKVFLRMITDLYSLSNAEAPRCGESANYDHRDIYQTHIERVLTSTNNFVISATVCYICYRQTQNNSLYLSFL